jgi:general stress protein YciG
MVTRSEAGRRGAQSLNSNPEKKRAAAKKAAETRKAHNPDAFREMGRLGGSHSHKND